MIKNETAFFGAGCFWGVEENFRKIKGVTSTTVGYMGGNLKNPSYEEVCKGKTNHAETIKIEYNPETISYEELLNIFWTIHNPTTKNRQGLDIGTQYRSIIFYTNETQKKIAKRSQNKLEKSNKFERKIMTEIKKASEFYKAEEYHQKYLIKKGLKTC